MSWSKISPEVEVWNEPCLGNNKVVEGKRFMALCLQPRANKPFRGLARQVITREGSENVPGFLDLSKLVIVESEDLLKWQVVGDLKIKGIEKVVENFQKDTTRFIGLEDPDILLDEYGVLHVYFTIAYRYLEKEEYDIFLGHAFGKSLEKLNATNPLLGPIEEEFMGFKEIAFSEKSTVRYYFNLVEAVRKREAFGDSVIACVRADRLGSGWNFEKISFYPEKSGSPWCNGHASPCRILPKEVINLNKRLRVLLINGREKNRIIDGKRRYGKFRPGLALYNTETGEIPWVDFKHLIEDPKATTITFASDIFALDREHILVYAHVNDSFVRVYRIELGAIKERLPK